LWTGSGLLGSYYRKFRNLVGWGVGGGGGGKKPDFLLRELLAHIIRFRTIFSAGEGRNSGIRKIIGKVFWRLRGFKEDV
jgi:hypothetical protein